MIRKSINKYFNKDSSGEEKKEAYDDLIHRKNEFLNYFSETEWEASCEDITNMQEQAPVVVISNKFRYWKLIMAAASVVVLVTIAGLIFSKRVFTKTTDFTQHNVRKVIEIFSEENTARKITMQDSSVVYLMPKSSIKYYTDYNTSKREILLNGEALFKVHKDDSRKFSVYCDSITTTALGTEFIVNNKDKERVTIKLLHGKISVEKSEKKPEDKIYYLVDSSSIAYDLRGKYFITTVDNNQIASNNLQKDIKKAGEKVFTENIKTDSSFEHSDKGTSSKIKGVRFNNKGLAAVLDYLSHNYNTKIQYPTKDISNITFVGTIRQNESVGSILRNIALMNGLKLEFDSSHNIYTLR